MQTLNALAKLNRVSLEWEPGHRGILGNEKNADSLARKGSQIPFTGPEPAVGLPKTTVGLSTSGFARATK